MGKERAYNHYQTHTRKPLIAPSTGASKGGETTLTQTHNASFYHIAAKRLMAAYTQQFNPPPTPNSIHAPSLSSFIMAFLMIHLPANIMVRVLTYLDTAERMRLAGMNRFLQRRVYEECSSVWAVIQFWKIDIRWV
jgi:hypothetical protein